MVFIIKSRNTISLKILEAYTRDVGRGIALIDYEALNSLNAPAGETRRFRPLIDLYREAGRRAGHSPDQLRVGVHSPGYIAETTQEAADDFFPGYARAFTDIGKERGWRPVTRSDFDAQRGPKGALLIGDPDEMVKKIIRHSKALGGISRITFQMNAASLPHIKMMRAIELLGKRVAPALREELYGDD